MSFGMIKNMSTGSLASVPEYEENDFESICPLGSGYFSHVWLAKFQSRRVVKKVAKHEPKALEQLENERNILRLLNHENIVALVAELPETNAIILELCPGGELAAYIEMGPFDCATAKRYSFEIANGLRYLHSKNILHNDLKGENILLTQSGHVRITDFGSSRMVRNGEILQGMEGSPSNVPPEMITENGYSYPRDWWSFGILVYQMLVGQLPFVGNNQLEVFMGILMKEPIFPERLDKNAKDFISALLTKDANQRLTDVFSHSWLSSGDRFGKLDTSGALDLIKRKDSGFHPSSERRSSEKTIFQIG